MTPLLRGVFDDGTRRRPGVPVDSRQALVIPRGASATLRIELVTPSGVPVELALSGTDRLRLSVRRLGGTDPEFAVDATAVTGGDGRPGLYQFALTPAMTAELAQSRYAFDVWARRGVGTIVQVIGLSELRLAPRAASRSIEA